jgi:hypothetical protein
MISNDVNRKSGTFKIVSPMSERLEDSKEFFVMNIVVEFGANKGTGMEGDRMKLAIRKLYGKNGSESVIGSVGFQDERKTGNEMGKDRSAQEGSFQRVESFLADGIEIPRNSFSCEACKRNDNVGISLNEPSIEVAESEEGLNVFNLPRSRPVGDNVDFLGVHGESRRREDESEIFDSVRVELALFWTAIQSMFPETS